VTPEAGVLVDPLDDDALVAALAGASALPSPNLAGREAAGAHDVRLQAERVEEILLRAARGSAPGSDPLIRESLPHEDP
jgi:hypothetical protein